MATPWAPSVSRLLRSGSGWSVALDALIVMAAVLLGSLAWSRWSVESGDVDRFLVLGAASLPVWLGIFRWQHLYHNRDEGRLIDDVRRVTHAVVFGAMGYVLLGWPVGVQVPRSIVLVLVLTLIPALLAERQVFRVVVRRRRRAGQGLRRVAILGANAEALELCRSLEDPILGHRVVAFISVHDDAPDSLSGLPVVRDPNPAAAASAIGAESVMIAATALEETASPGLLRAFLDRGIAVEMTSALTDVAVDRVQVRALGRLPIIYVQPGYRGGWRAAAKRAFDVVLAACTLVLLSPVLAAAALAIKVNDRGPVFYSQTRVGRRGSPFRIHKLRTMVVGADERLVDLRERNESDGPLFKMADDPRVTRVGRILRATSIDELPQLWNVIRGEMSLVGPRPALPAEAEEWSHELRNRLRVRPGVTGMWQVNGRSGTSFAEYQRLDLFYIDNWSMLTDLGILVRTIPAVLGRRGAS